jgi:formate dehydrogenase subunit gamma
VTTSSVSTESTPASPAGRLLDRFSGAERALHWATAAVVLTCALTGLVLYVGPLTAWVGRRTLVRDTHVVSGVLMPVPLLVAYAGRWRAAVRADVRRLARWTAADRRWLLSRGRDAADQVGKFNAGQKANAAFVAGMIPVMLVTGVVMRWYDPLGVDLPYRTGATFVHDWTAVVTWVVVTGHILVALAHPGSLRSMLTGRMSRRWAEDHHPRWVEEVRPDPDRTPAPTGPRPPSSDQTAAP